MCEMIETRFLNAEVEHKKVSEISLSPRRSYAGTLYIDMRRWNFQACYRHRMSKRSINSCAVQHRDHFERVTLSYLNITQYVYISSPSAANNMIASIKLRSESNLFKCERGTCHPFGRL